MLLAGDFVAALASTVHQHQRCSSPRLVQDSQLRLTSLLPEHRLGHLQHVLIEVIHDGTIIISVGSNDILPPSITATEVVILFQFPAKSYSYL